MNRDFWTINDDDAFIKGLKEGLVDDPYDNWIAARREQMIAHARMILENGDPDEETKQLLMKQIVKLSSKKDHFKGDDGLFEV